VAVQERAGVLKELVRGLVTARIVALWDIVLITG
jgi:hypothetical protein